MNFFLNNNYFHLKHANSKIFKYFTPSTLVLRQPQYTHDINRGCGGTTSCRGVVAYMCTPIKPFSRKEVLLLKKIKIKIKVLNGPFSQYIRIQNLGKNV